MNKTVDFTTETSQNEPPAHIEKRNECLSSKRGRDDSLKHHYAESPKKIRKKLAQDNVKVAPTDKEQPHGTFVSKMISKEKTINCGKQEEKNYTIDIANDSILLKDLLGDFDTDFQTTNIAGSSGAKNDKSIKPATQEEPCGSIEGSQINKKLSGDNESDETLADSTKALLDSEFGVEFHDFFDEAFDEENLKPADLQEFRRCKILEIEREKRYTRLTVKDSLEHSTAKVSCYGFWREIRVEINDTVSIKAKKGSDSWIIDNENGFLVTQPHTLISGTSIVAAHFCIRRGVLSERFRGIDSLPNLKIEDSGMTIGTMIHEALQTVLREKLSSMPDVRKVINDIINSRRGAFMLYEADLSLRDCKQQMEAYIPKIVNFVKRYILGDADHIKDNNFKGQIARIREIEENIWLPAMGLKGKIDVTIDATVNLQRKIMPLEIKTGKPTFSAEHRGQLILYNMMMGFLGHDVDTGLLLYIKENIMQEVKNNHPEERDLILLRNSFAGYITMVPQYDAIKNEDGTVLKLWKSMDLPEPINHRMACKKCPYSTICSIYAEKDVGLELSESHVLKEIVRGAMNYLTQEHIDYVMKWVTMLRLEDSVTHDITTVQDIWLLDPRKREKKGACLCNMEVCGDVVREGDKYLHTFVRKDQNEEYPITDLSKAYFTEIDYILVSTNTRVNVSAGFLKRKTKHGIEILLDRNVVRQNPTATFHLDKNPFSGLSMRSLSNVACLLNDNEITEKLRGIVIEKKPATFVDKISKSDAEMIAPLLFRLNKYQRQAILMVLTANDYLLIKGMPGTGKTQTLVILIEVLVKLGRSVLVTAHTHSAVDNILLKLDEHGVDFVRLGSSARINPKLMHKSEEVLTADCKTPESLINVYRNKNVVAVTCFAAIHSCVANRIFDVCLVDESTQVLQPTVLRPIYSGSKFVLVGDPQQLPPVIRNDEARKMGMSESLFARLQSEHNTVTLKLQYRMNRRIMSIANDLTYEGNLKAGNSKVADATLRLKDEMVLESCERWVAKALSLNLEDAVVMLNTGETHSLHTKSELVSKPSEDDRKVRNVFEAAIIMRLVNVLQKGGVEANSIGIICPFRSQVELLKSLLEDIEVNTVDQYQGRDKEVIFYSCTRSMHECFDAPQEFEVLQDAQRLNVAVTRAKHKLIMVGDKQALKRFTPFEKLFKVIADDIVDLEPGRDNFSWEDLVQLTK